MNLSNTLNRENKKNPKFLQRELTLLFLAYTFINAFNFQILLLLCVYPILFLMSLHAQGFLVSSTTRLWCEVKINIRFGRNMEAVPLIASKVKGWPYLSAFEMVFNSNEAEQQNLLELFPGQLFLFFPCVYLQVTVEFSM